VRFLDAHDGALGPRADWAGRLATWLDELQPDLVYLPFVGELPEDHWQANRLFEAALRAARGGWSQAVLLRSYEVWSPVIANRVLDITALAARKRELLGLYASQLRDVDYRPGVAGLNTWRAMLLPAVGQGQAEAYLECSVPAWRDLLRAMPRPDAPRS
jgi:LmbE family N-acetylglucosaminyl deacetylase